MRPHRWRRPRPADLFAVSPALPSLAVASSAGCWPVQDTGVHYHWCCNSPPGYTNYNSACFSPPGGHFTYETCCDYVIGRGIRALPVLWTERLELEMAGHAWMTLLQSPHDRVLDLHDSDSPEGDSMCVLWDDSLARLVATMLIPRKGFRLLDAGTGVGAVAVSAAKRGLEVLAVDQHSCALKQAAFNARANNASAVHVARFDLCSGGEAFERRFGGRPFDIVTVGPTGKHAASLYDCVFELAVRFGSKDVRVLVVEYAWIRRDWEVDRRGLWRGALRRHNHVPVEAYGGNPYTKELRVVDVWRRA